MQCDANDLINQSPFSIEIPVTNENKQEYVE